MENLTPNLRSVGKTEMAHLYHPCENVSDVAARHWLNRKIRQNKHLLTLLERNGYNKYSHFFTPMPSHDNNQRVRHTNTIVGAKVKSDK